MRMFFVAAAAAVVVSASPAAALTVGYTLQISGDSPANNNVPRIILTNTSGPDVELLRFQVTIGNTSFNFDEVYDFADAVGDAPVAPPGGTFLVNTAVSDTEQAGVRTDIAGVIFTDFDPGETASFRVDIDRDSTNSTENWRTVMAGASSPAVASALFSVPFLANPFQLQITLDSGSIVGSVGTWEAAAQLRDPNAPSTAIPVPAALPLMGLGVAALAGLRRRRARG